MLRPPPTTSAILTAEVALTSIYYESLSIFIPLKSKRSCIIWDLRVQRAPAGKQTPGALCATLLAPNRLINHIGFIFSIPSSVILRNI